MNQRPEMNYIAEHVAKEEDTHMAQCPHSGPSIRDKFGRPKKIRCQGRVNIPVYKLIRNPTQSISIELLCPDCYRYFYVRGVRMPKKPRSERKKKRLL